jgi:hypothetical protein
MQHLQPTRDLAANTYILTLHGSRDHEMIWIATHIYLPAVDCPNNEHEHRDDNNDLDGQTATAVAGHHRAIVVCECRRGYHLALMERGKPAEVLLGLTLVLSLTACALLGCKPSLSKDPGLLQDDLGTGVHLGMSVSAAKSQASAAPKGLLIRAIQREELPSRSPYAERPPDSDLVLALYTAFPQEGPVDNGVTSYDTIEELLCYLAPPNNSVITLLGRPAAQYTADDVVALLGQPVDRAETAEGHVHLTYIFSVAEVKGKALRLVTSHHIHGDCFAVKLALEQRPN